METMTVGAETEVTPTRRGQRLAAWSGIAGALLLGAAAYLISSLSPSGSGRGAVRRISDFYAEGGDSNTLVAAEPLSLIGGFLFLWFLSQLVARLRKSEGAPSRSSIPVPVGGVTFIVLAFTAITAQTTVAGSLVFFDAFKPDPHTAMLFSHLGYVLLTGAMLGAAVLLAGAGALIRRTSTLPRWLGTTAFVLLPISLISIFFVWLPLVLFLIWTVLVGVYMLRTE